MPAKSQPPRKHMPQRTCIACGQKTDKRRLIRLVYVPAADPPIEGAPSESRVLVDPTGKRNGRGAYLCSQPACWDKAIHGQVLNKAWKVTLTSAEKQVIAAYKMTVIDRNGSGSRE